MIKDIDTSLMVYEADYIMPNVGNWAGKYNTIPLKIKPVLGLSPQDAERQFLDMFNYLTEQLKCDFDGVL